jgi:hypothetical protein
MTLPQVAVKWITHYKKYLSAANNGSSGGDRCDQWSGDYGDGFGQRL